jgi:hypothetical protein
MAVLRDRHTAGWSNQSFIIAHGGLGVCDGAHSWFVLKKGSGVIAENAMSGAPGDGTPTSQEEGMKGW